MNVGLIKTTTVLVVMGALGTIKKDTENYTNKKFLATSTYMNSRK